MSLSVGGVLSTRALAAEVAEVLRSIEDGLEYHKGKRDDGFTLRPERWHLFYDDRERLRELRLRLEEIEIGFR
jgi:hypothetical protein